MGRKDKLKVRVRTRVVQSGARNLKDSILYYEVVDLQTREVVKVLPEQLPLLTSRYALENAVYSKSLGMLKYKPNTPSIAIRKEWVSATRNIINPALVDGILVSTDDIRCPDSKRYCFKDIKKYLDDVSVRKVCALRGLRRTGKTVLLQQAYRYSVKTLKVPSVFITIRMGVGIKMRDLCRVLDYYLAKGVRNFFIDEVTFISDFQSGGNVLADYYVSVKGAHLVLAGTYSLSFIGASKDTLYDRVELISTSYISYLEYKKLFPERDLDTYLKSACILSDLFSDYNATHDYIETSITSNIEFSLRNAFYQRWYSDLRKLYENGDLHSAIIKCIDRHSFDVSESVLNGAFTSSGLLSSAVDLYRKSGRSDITREMLENVLYDYKYRLLMRGKLLEGVSSRDMQVIRYNLKELGVLDNVTTEDDSLAIVQYGLVYSCALHLLDSIIAESSSSNTSFDLGILVQKVHEDVLGHILETMLQYETTLAARRNGCRVEKYSTGYCEFDMVVFRGMQCSLYEIKHSSKIASEQSRWLRDREAIGSFMKTHKGVSVKSKNVIYYGETKTVSIGGDTIQYINVEDYLKRLSSFDARGNLQW